MYFVLDIKVDEWDCRTEKEARDKETGAFCGGRSEDNGTCMIRDGEDDVAVVCTLVREERREVDRRDHENVMHYAVVTRSDVDPSSTRKGT